jgi:hypothetical protein
MRFMGEVPLSHDAVRAYLDAAVAEAAERWVGRAADATAYADLVAAVLARREALSPLRHVAEWVDAPPPPVIPEPRHTERRGRPRWPLTGGGPVGSIADRAEPAGPPAYAAPPPPINPTLDVRRGVGLPSRPPGRHRTPPVQATSPEPINLNDNLSSVLDWLGRPET